MLAVRVITVIAIIVAVVAGVTAGAILLVTPITRSVGIESGQQEPVVGVEGNSSYRQVDVMVNGVRLVADVAETNEQRTKGLTVKDTLAENEAMLFLFETPQKYPFWMPPEMKFPIDIIWLDNNKTVVHIEASAQPCDIRPPVSCPNYVPEEEAQYVLETVTGFAQKHNVTEGTEVKFDA